MASAASTSVLCGFIKEKESVRIEKVPEERSGTGNVVCEPSMEAGGTQPNMNSIRAYEPITASEINVEGGENERKMILSALVCKQYPLEYVRERIVEDTVEDLLVAGIIQPSKSPYNSPTVLVKKKNGDWRTV